MRGSGGSSVRSAEAVTFLVPRRDATGKAQSPSESLVFMQQLFAGPESADELVIELDAAEGRARARGVALAAPAAPAPPRELVVADLEFGRDLRRVADGCGGQAEAGVARAVSRR